MNEFEKLFEALSKTTSETLVRDMYRMFETIQKGQTVEDGCKLVAFFKMVGFYEANINSSSNITKKALKKLRDAIVVQINIINDATHNSFWKPGTELQKQMNEMMLEEYEPAPFDEE
jgi:hypothetical protein